MTQAGPFTGHRSLLFIETINLKDTKNELNVSNGMLVDVHALLLH